MDLGEIYPIFTNLNHNVMLNIVLFGPPGAGKGTQAVKLVEKYKLVHLSTGDIFRANIKGGTELGKLAKSYMDKGDLVPDEVTIRMLESEVNKQINPKGFIFDGFPRTTAQAQALDKFLAEKNIPITLTLALEVDEEELTKRIILRGKESGRADDQDENIVRNRVKEYSTKTAPLKDFYAKQGKLKTIHGIGSIDAIFAALCKAINTL
jgi:adenylate kinase